MKSLEQGKLCNEHFKAEIKRQKVTESEIQSSDLKSTRDDISDRSKKGYPIHLNDDNMSIASLSTAQSNEVTIPIFDMRKYTGPVAVDWYDIICGDGSAKYFQMRTIP